MSKSRTIFAYSQINVKQRFFKANDAHQCDAITGAYGDEFCTRRLMVLSTTTTGLQHGTVSLPHHAVPATPKDHTDRFRCQTPWTSASPFYHWVGISTCCNGATSRFTFVTAWIGNLRRLCQKQKGGLYNLFTLQESKICVLRRQF